MIRLEPLQWRAGRLHDGAGNSSGAPANERGGGSRNGWGPIRPRPARGPHTRGYRARAVLSARPFLGQPGPAGRPCDRAALLSC